MFDIFLSPRPPFCFYVWPWSLVPRKSAPIHHGISAAILIFNTRTWFLEQLSLIFSIKWLFLLGHPSQRPILSVPRHHQLVLSVDLVLQLVRHQLVCLAPLLQLLRLGFLLAVRVLDLLLELKQQLQVLLVRGDNVMYDLLINKSRTHILRQGGASQSQLN